MRFWKCAGAGMLDKTEGQEFHFASARRENVSFSDVTSLVRANLRVFFFCALSALAIGIAYVVLAERKFTAQTQLLVDARAPQILRDPNIDSNAGPDSAFVETHIVSLRSRSIASDVVRRLVPGEAKESAPDASMIASVLEAVGLAGDEDAVDPETRFWRRVERFEDSLVVARVGISNVIGIRYTASDPRIAARIANDVAQTYINSLIEVRADAARRASEWLEDRIVRLRVEMNAAARRAQQFRARQDFRIGSDVSARVEGQNAEPATLEELELTAETYRRIYQNFYTAFAEAVQRESYPVASVRVISVAQPPLRPSRPRPLLIIAIVLAAGIAIGLAIAVLRGSREAPA